MSFHLICPSIHRYPFIHWFSPRLFPKVAHSQWCLTRQHIARVFAVSRTLSLAYQLEPIRKLGEALCTPHISSPCFSSLLGQPSWGTSSLLLGTRRLLCGLQLRGTTRRCPPCSSSLRDFHPAKLLHPCCFGFLICKIGITPGPASSCDGEELISW